MTFVKIPSHLLKDSLLVLKYIVQVTDVSLSTAVSMYLTNSGINAYLLKSYFRSGTLRNPGRNIFYFLFSGMPKASNSLVA